MAENIPKDHISRTAVYNLLNAIGGCGADIETDPYTYGWDKAIDAAIEEIGKLPAVEYTPVKHGHWVYNQNGHDWGLGAWECSLCHSVNNNLPSDKRFSPYVYAGAKYCPQLWG